jgi:hypothetical protein
LSSWTVRRPGFAAIVGAAPDAEIAKMIVEEYQKRSIYIFLAANHNGTTVIEQLVEAGVQVGWNTRSCPSARISPRPSSPSGLPTGRPWPSAASSRAITRKC